MNDTKAFIKKTITLPAHISAKAEVCSEFGIYNGNLSQLLANLIEKEAQRLVPLIEAAIARPMENEEVAILQQNLRILQRPKTFTHDAPSDNLDSPIP